MAIDLSALLGQLPDYSQFISPAEQQRLQSNAAQQALLNSAIAALSMTGRTREPISTGQVLAGMLGAGSEGYQQSFDRTLKQLVTGMQLAEFKKKQDAQQRLQEAIKSATREVPQIVAVPTETGEVPTAETMSALTMAGAPKKVVDYSKLQDTLMLEAAGQDPLKFLELQASLAKAGQKTYKQVDLGNAIAFMDDNLNIVKQIPKQKEGKEIDTFGRENTLRSQYLDKTKDYTGIAQAYSKVEAAAKDPSAAGDLSLIFGYMKILDPASVVRETEFANAQNAAGVPDQIRNMWNRALRGERLNENQRTDFVESAKKLVISQKSQLDNLNKQYIDIASAYQLDPTKIVIDPFKTLDLTLKPSDNKPKPSARDQLGLPALPAGVIVRQR